MVDHVCGSCCESEFCYCVGVVALSTFSQVASNNLHTLYVQCGVKPDVYLC